MIIVIDYGMGNLHSVRKALEVVGAKAKVSSRAEDILKADKIVFPGVGSFGEAMKELNKRKLVKPIKDAINVGKPFLGLCLGLQLLFERSEESPGVRGLGLLKGAVKRFKGGVRRYPSVPPIRRNLRMKFSYENFKVPHMGWNDIAYSVERIAYREKILKNVPNNSYMYFVHSYYVKPEDKRVVLTTTSYGMDFASGVCKDNIYAFQFHPEKSQELGLKILKNFVRL
ncbi:MAG: imidazole glycerol phosphate synthase subunit HisH [Candidatus Omnitrophica bacterium]|nr:imidazole glycerol phosphate synthase subunit HisH [Candidatus Omnitrophota bacterium]